MQLLESLCFCYPPKLCLKLQKCVYYYNTYTFKCTINKRVQSTYTYFVIISTTNQDFENLTCNTTLTKKCVLRHCRKSELFYAIVLRDRILSRWAEWDSPVSLSAGTPRLLELSLMKASVEFVKVWGDRVRSGPLEESNMSNVVVTASFPPETKHTRLVEAC